MLMPGVGALAQAKILVVRSGGQHGEPQRSAEPPHGLFLIEKGNVQREMILACGKQAVRRTSYKLDKAVVSDVRRVL